MNIRKAGIITKKGSQEPERIGRELAEWLATRGIETRFNEVMADMDILVILGGDGTLLHVADRASRFDIPVVGVNLGDLGFLTEVAADERQQALEAILAGSIVIEERMMLRARLVRGTGNEQETEPQYCLNEVVVSKDNVAQISRFATWADSEYLTTYRADGLIFSTPTGSTAYNLSAGGPIVHPRQQGILVTPICPFMLDSRPVLLPADMTLSTRLADGGSSLRVIVDGRPVWEMGEADRLEVRAAGKPLRLISSPNKGYFDILRKKLNWGGPAVPAGRRP